MTTMQWDEESVIKRAEERLKQFSKFETGDATLRDVQESKKKHK
jgi:hypothetical protein